MLRKSLLLILSVLSLGACTAQDGKPLPKSSEPQFATAKPILADTESFENLLQTPGVQLIDVRTPSEYSSGYISNAKLVNIANYDEFKATVAKLDKAKPVMVYCAAGGRSNQAAAYLSDQGFGEVYDLKGGINAWKSNGKNLALDN